MKFKKPFKETKIGKILTSPIVKGILTKLPFGVGSLMGEVVNSTSTPEGAINREQLIHSLVKIGIYVVLIYLVLSGRISWDDADSAKGFITN